MTDQQPMDLVVPVTGEIVNLENPVEVCQALETLRKMKSQIREVEDTLIDAITNHSKEYGTKTIPLANGRKATVKGSTQTVYDAIAIMEDLRRAGMPETRIMEIVSETVEYKVRAVEAKRAAEANEHYKEIIERNSRIENKRPTIEIN